MLEESCSNTESLGTEVYLREEPYKLGWAFGFYCVVKRFPEDAEPGFWEGCKDGVTARIRNQLAFGDRTGSAGATLFRSVAGELVSSSFGRKFLYGP
jgi:hypothetical protein